jgi:16S rRNA C967 or C1407 C5-methylase (RsmB/RsmF family)
MLVHQCRRSYSPLLVITTHKGQMFPSIRPSASPADRRGCFFDRILCDVPCSGDGTLRKSPHIWPKWTTNSGVDLHPLQLMIARRGFELLKPGGLMVYSTCSMSPYGECVAVL